MDHRPVLYIPIGLPGSGKTSFFRRMKGIRIISGDDVRRELFGSEQIQCSDAFLLERGIDIAGMKKSQRRALCNEYVWGIVNQRVEQVLVSGEDCVYEGLNVRQARRRETIRRYGKIAVIHGVWFDVKIDVCIRRDGRRSRSVGRRVICLQASRFDRPVMEEGYDILDTVDENGVLVSRLRRSGDQPET